jgi:phage replication initiation protein
MVRQYRLFFLEWLMAKPVGTQDRAYWSALVVDGEHVKMRLMAERQATQTPVHVDWVRFTCFRRNSPTPSAAVLFPPVQPLSPAFTLAEYREKEKELQARSAQNRMPLNDLAADDFAAAAESFELAQSVCKALGPAFSVFQEPKKGMDFYRCRWSIELNGNECGWVGFLAATSSPRQDSQALTLHVNLYGMACTFADTGWRDNIADIVDEYEGTLTRCDLALDYFDGLPGGIESIRQDYRDGLCNVGGRKLKFSMVGDWKNNHDRSIYLGSREAGKVTNAYEKGDQLFGEKFNSDWLRVELRYGNKHRILSSEMLRRPADFFAGASEWHTAMLLKADAIPSPEPVPCIPRLQLETVEAECARNVRWLRNTAAASMAVAYQYLGQSELLSILDSTKLPGRLKKFSQADIKRCMSSAFERLETLFVLKKVEGTNAIYSVESAVSYA